MDETNQLKLDLNESLFFETGYEIAEMINISLTPEISIQSFDDYVSIRGVVELTGQYIKENEIFDQPLLKDEMDGQWVNKVRNKPNNQVEFSHYFPIDISVPLNRISNVDDVSVKIVSFDYDLSQSNHLQIFSTVHIYGIDDDQPVIEDEAREEVIALDDDFSFEMLPISDEPGTDSDQEDRQKKTFEMSEAEKSKQVEQTKQVTGPVADDSKEKEKIETPTKEENVIKLVPDEGSPSEVKDDASQQPDRQKVQQEATKAKDLSTEQLETTELKEAGEEEDDQLTEEKDLIRIEDPHHTVEEMAQTDEEQNDVKDVSYLAHMFQSEDEKRFTNMRLYIVQNQDTLQSIAERYEVEPLTIINENNLQDEHLSAGQLLYIPQ